MSGANTVAPYSVAIVLLVLFIMAVTHRYRRKQQKIRNRRDIEAGSSVLGDRSFAPVASVQTQPRHPIASNVAARASVDSQLPIYTQPVAEPPQPESLLPPPYAPEDPAPRVTKPPSVLLR
ncbi:hypothetical protein FBU31_005418 [Coemansia sp. 'formosensis']|nr:hypothetical protein FBU31_005418 [Coemansia sp. 'formosensis']